MKDKAQALREYVETLKHRYMEEESRFLHMHATELTTSELKVLVFVGRKQRCIMREISDYLLVPKNNLTAIMNNLVRKGFVRRKRCSSDRRVVRVALTDKGDEIFQQEMDAHLQLSQGMLVTLEPQEQTHLLEILSKITNID